MKIVTVIGARPQFVKAAVVSRALAREGVAECVVHTGQHYDEKMSQVFFDQLKIPVPTHNLQAGSGSHGKQTGLMLTRLEEVLLTEKPDAVLVYGDTNSTLAGSLAAVKLHIPIAHVEAGLRSFNRKMPEEVNRVMTDHISTRLFCPTQEAVANLAAEGIRDGVHLVGDVMYDCAVQFAGLAEQMADPLKTHGLAQAGYVLMTCHRAENTDDPARLAEIVEGANAAADQMPVVFPVHPRTRGRLHDLGVALHRGLKLVEPVSYFDMLLLERESALILTDSGGVQKEAFFYGVPCVTMRDETEWVETVQSGANLLVGACRNNIARGISTQLAKRGTLPPAGPYYGEGDASRRIAELTRLVAG